MQRLVPLALCLALLACNRTEPVRDGQRDAARDADHTREVQPLVEAFGAKLRLVSLLASPDVLAQSMREHYGPFVSPMLLEQWIADPSKAPGRKTSSPSPARIEITSTMPTGDGLVPVRGEIVEVTSESGGPEFRTPVELVVARSGNEWRITHFTILARTETTAPPAAQSSETTATIDPKQDSDTADALAVITDYYDSIGKRDYPHAYRLWSGDGAASKQSFDAFRAGFANTAAVEVTTGTPGRIEGAAGSRYIEIPVEITARTTDGTTQNFRGKYVLRRSVVDGATEDQRQWRIHSAEIR